MSELITDGKIPSQKDVIRKAIRSEFRFDGYENIDKCKLTTGIRCIRFCETYLKIPEGEFVGQPVVLEPFQKAFIRDLFDNPHGTRFGIFSIARKNAKSTLVAMIALFMVLDSKSGLRNSTTIVAALTREQARVTFDLAAKMVRLSEKLENLVRVVDSRSMIVALNTGNMFKAIAKDTSGKSTMGLSICNLLLDESGAIVGQTDPFIEALQTAQSAYGEKSKFITFSTASPSDSDWLSVQTDNAIRNPDPTTIVHYYERDESLPLGDISSYYWANPAMPKFRSLVDLTKQVKRAIEMPSAEASVLNLLGNQRISLLSLFVSPKVWKENKGQVRDDLFYTQPVSIGLDLSARNDLTSCVACVKDPETNEIHTKAFTYTPLNTLEEREASDRAPYKTWVDQGHMTALPGVSLDYDMLAEAIKADTEGMDVTRVSFDRWRIEIFQASADRCGLFQDAEWIQVGQGFKDFSPRLEALETMLLQRRVHHGSAPLLTMAASNAIVVTDPTGSKKLDKSKATQKIDPLVALTMAIYPLTDGQTEGVDVESMII